MSYFPIVPRACLALAVILLWGAAMPQEPARLPSGPGNEPPLSRLSPELANLRVTSTTGHRISGSLFDEAGQPLADVIVQVRPASRKRGRTTVGQSISGILPWAFHAASIELRVATNWDGRFSLPLGSDPLGYHLILPVDARGEENFQLTEEPIRVGSPDLNFTVPRSEVNRQRPEWIEGSHDPESATGAAGPASRVEITVRDPLGQPYDFDNRLNVYDAVTGHRVASGERYRKSPWLRLLLPAGRYIARVTTDESVPMCGSGWQPNLAPYGCDPVEFIVETGARLKVEMNLFQGGRLRLALPTDTLLSDPLLRAALAKETHGANAYVDALDGPSPGRAELIGIDGHPLPLIFYAPQLKYTYRYDRILPGTECLSHTIVRPGHYTLRLRVPGFRDVDMPIEISADKIEKVTVQLKTK